MKIVTSMLFGVALVLVCAGSLAEGAPTLSAKEQNVLSSVRASGGGPDWVCDYIVGRCTYAFTRNMPCYGTSAGCGPCQTGGSQQFNQCITSDCDDKIVWECFDAVGGPCYDVPLDCGVADEGRCTTTMICIQSSTCSANPPPNNVWCTCSSGACAQAGDPTAITCDVQGCLLQAP